MTPDMHTLKASYHTLGCKLNFSETSTLGKMLAERGIVRIAPGETPDICVINTCSVTEMADKKGRQLIRRIATLWPKATVIVTGCYAQLKPDEVAAIEGVDIVLGHDRKHLIAEYLDRWMATRQPQIDVVPSKDIREFRPSCDRGDRTRYFLKIQDGCDYFCSYCTIPFARGRSRSGLISDLVAQAEGVAAEGGKEIVLTGVNIGDFGKNTGESFFELLKRLDAVKDIERYRISSIEPDLLTHEIIDWIGKEARTFMPHFHIPLQSGDDEVLRLMRRHYDTALFADRIAHIREVMPDAFIGVDVIAGTRGETPARWESGLRFIESLDVTRLHVFPYSERPGTRALELDDPVSQEEKHRRVKVLTDLSEKKYREFAQRMIDTVRPVLWEQPKPDMPMHGFTDNYLRVETEYVPEMIGKVTDARLGDDMGEYLYAELI